ncbi:MAG: ABC transporter ATP-binding protein [Chloroflexi bacterium]|nr:ABC transporter ATP-binding protein [Chloroflexota bacterium]
MSTDRGRYNLETSMEYAIETRDLTKRFGDFTAVSGVTLNVRPGEVLVLLGPNGAGKTTTTRMLASILLPTRGVALVAGFDVAGQAAEVRRRVGLLTEHHGLYTRMRAGEYLSFFGSIYGLSDADARRRAEDLLDQVGMPGIIDRRLGEFSKGMRQKLALVRALLHDPPVLLLDEPTSAMDPASARLVRDSILRLRSSQRTLVVTTHNLAEAEQLADRIAIIRQGSIAALGTVQELKLAHVGPPIMELRAACPLDGAMRVLPGDLQVVARGEDWLRYQAPDPADANPRVLAAAASAGLPVVLLTEVGRSLEDVYLRVVGAPAPQGEE